MTVLVYLGIDIAILFAISALPWLIAGLIVLRPKTQLPRARVVRR